MMDPLIYGSIGNGYINLIDDIIRYGYELGF